MQADNINYTEGNTYSFTIKNQIELPENEKFYVLEDQTGRKQLLNSDYYEKYDLKIGQNINCRLDHINCSGKIFLEPEHPYYKEGEYHDFLINEIGLNLNKFDNYYTEIKAFDAIGNEAICKIDDESYENFSAGQIIRCKVERIKKGKLHLSLENNRSSADFKRGDYYMFFVHDIRILSDNVKYYILSDDQNSNYLLKFEYYNHHKLSVGQTIKCSVIKYSSKGYYILEPKHPYYEIGKSYEFEFINEEKDSKGIFTGNYDITVKDIYNENIKFISSESLSEIIKKHEMLNCKVIGIKKGKPLLSFSQF